MKPLSDFTVLDDVVVHRAWLLVCALGALAACSESTPPQGQGGSTSEGGGGTGGSGTGQPTQTWMASFVAETEVGFAPSMLSFSNESLGILTGTIRATQFWQIGPNEPTEPQLAFSTNVQQDAQIGFHESKDPVAPCTFLTVEVTGVDHLEPGQGYLFRVFDDVPPANFGGEIIDHDLPEPFTGVRARLSGPLPIGSTITMSLNGTPETFNLIPDTLSDYALVNASNVSAADIVITSPAGDVFSSNSPVAMSGLYGVTVHLGLKPHADAFEVVELSHQ